ncbi:hypothetical protein PF005_g19289 [Phytophthora fragariae]|uniref:Uncharacterized protein n=1 Tax=Phytophthora fragariae TaxID=53985 RepID=A0A6A3WT49_9STRA|nr:hypothetical protein PF010_g18573 [Phytophthora fragariae]KAE9190323.1 hypothetical protein PF005_g19289 [Phytophthora fragariae]KAE9292819.1 hypothetical protein PF001_g18544 [Phytophthora fragariae]
MGTEYHRMIGVLHASVAVVHAAYIVWMIGWSYRKKDLVFAIYNVFKLPINLEGVDGPNFDIVLLCREIVETALQTQQAYRMSLLLPRRGLNRGYVALLVLNCWSTALVHSVFHYHATRRRLLALVCDCVLDLVSSVGITTVLVGIYLPDFDFDPYGFPFLKWYEDVWRVYAMSEFQMILVSSWGDLAMRFIFAMNMLGNLNNMKKLMRARPSKPLRDKIHPRRATVVAPFHSSLANLRKTMPHFDGMDPEAMHFWVG